MKWTHIAWLAAALAAGCSGGVSLEGDGDRDDVTHDDADSSADADVPADVPADSSDGADAEAEADAEAGADTVGDASDASDATRPDGTVDAGPDAPWDGGWPVEDESGCGCRTTARPGSWGAPLGLLVLAFGFRRRRRTPGAS